MGGGHHNNMIITIKKMDFIKEVSWFSDYLDIRITANFQDIDKMHTIIKI